VKFHVLLYQKSSFSPFVSKGLFPEVIYFWSTFISICVSMFKAANVSLLCRELQKFLLPPVISYHVASYLFQVCGIVCIPNWPLLSLSLSKNQLCPLAFLSAV
jgi:hypothetical protein